jgi:DNA mismatch repair protein MutS
MVGMSSSQSAATADAPARGMALSGATSSVLFDDSVCERIPVEGDHPTFFGDLNLDQVVRSITTGRDEYDLTPFFGIPLGTVEAISHRHEVFRDLEHGPLLAAVRTFADEMRSMRRQLEQASKLYDVLQRKSWILDAVAVYCDAIARLTDDLEDARPRSRALRSFLEYLSEYRRSEAFSALAREAHALKERLASVRYCLHIVGNKIEVSGFRGEADYTAEVTATFEKFKQGAVKDRLARFRSSPDMNHVEAGVLALVARLHPDIFAALDAFADQHPDYVDDTIANFDREIQFYLGFLSYIEPLRRAGLQFCYPQVADRPERIAAAATFDLALASKLVAEKAQVVCNDFFLQQPERIFVVTGPNQGGKTTFARTFGQLHYLASLGCLVPGTRAQLSLFDHLFTHFERGENLKDSSGKLQDDLVRIHGILEQATDRSIIIMNEIFTSTTLQDAVFLGTKVLQRIVECGCPSVCVTFVDELASLSRVVVSMVSSVVPDNPAIRTYKIVRRPADGLAYANAVAEKHGLTYERLTARINS